MHIKEPRTLIAKEKGFPRYFWIRALSTQQGGYVRATNLLYYYYYYYYYSESPSAPYNVTQVILIF